MATYRPSTEDPMIRCRAWFLDCRRHVAVLLAALMSVLTACDNSPTRVERSPVTGGGGGGTTVLIQLQGTIRSAADSLPIAGVVVAIFDPNTRRQRTSDAEGRYAVDVSFRKPCSGVQLWVAMENDDGWVGQTRALQCAPQLLRLDFYLEPDS